MMLTTTTTTARRYMETATIEQTFLEDRDFYRREAEAAMEAGDMKSFHENARRYHELAVLVGYPEDTKTN